MNIQVQSPLALGESLIAERFRLEAIAGSGGMGTVYRARDLQTDAPVALKLLHSNGIGEAERFIREANLLAEVRHPGIVSYISHGATATGLPFLVMEWLDGEDLAQRMRRQPLTLAETLTLLRCVAEALSIAHRRGIVHRDLKPSNLFLCDRELERVKILDFGIARRFALSRPMTNTGMIVGTPEYMAPEQARGQRDIGPSADIFALGCVLFECLLGEPPFVADHIAAVLAKILFEDPPGLRNLHGRVPERVAGLVGRMLAKSTIEFAFA